LHVIADDIADIADDMVGNAKKITSEAKGTMRLF
jgi:hypothetical protein